jgi:hypothetical protein
MVSGGPSTTSPLPSVAQTGPDRTSTPGIAAGDGPDLRPELDALRAQVARLQQMVVPDVAPPQYDE